MPTIGIPRALYYFHYHPLWKSFLAGLGFQVVVSPPTNKEILEWGLCTCVDGICLPIKAFIGHCFALVRSGVDFLFVPQIISVSRGEYTCPNFLGLPDLVQQYFPPKIKVLSPVLDGRRGPRGLRACYCRFGFQYAAKKTVRRSWREAVTRQLGHEQKLQRSTGGNSQMLLLLLGPRYLTDDPFLSGNLLNQLERLGPKVLTAANTERNWAGQTILPIAKPFFWTEARQSWQAVQHFLAQIDGIVTAAPFGCGAQSLLSVFVQKWAAEGDLPKLELHHDEHTSELGTLTRLEAFYDLLERKRSKHEDNLSPSR